jgi:hypothetical protein
MVHRSSNSIWMLQDMDSSCICQESSECIVSIMVDYSDIAVFRFSCELLCKLGQSKSSVDALILPIFDLRIVGF